jgi:hypothetical protein
MSRKMIIPALATLVIAALPLVGGQASAQVHSNAVVFNTPFQGVLFQAPGSNGGCTGPEVYVSGSSAIQSYIVNIATAYCNSQSNKATAYDVEYGKTDSCPGDAWAAAADAATFNKVGVSDVFPQTCSVSKSAVNDIQVGANLVNFVTACPGATGVQGSTGANPCQGSTGLQTGFDCTTTFPTLNDYFFANPGNLSVDQARLILAAAVSPDMASIGGAQCSTETVQQRVSGSGTRNTICDVVYESLTGSNAVNCATNANGDNTVSTNGPAKGTGDMLTDVCGSATTNATSNGTDPRANGGANPETTGVYPIGYTSRSGIVIDPRASGTNPQLGGCGIISYQGYDGYNRGCSYTNTVASNTYSSLNTNNVRICNGDLQVALNQYTIWGYEHVVLPATAGAGATAFANYITTHPLANETDLQTTGFIRTCQLNYTRSIDGGPVKGTTPTC